MAHAGNIETMCKQMKKNIIIHDVDPVTGGMKTHEFGKKYKNTDQPIELDFYRATSENAGHYNARGGMNVIPSGKNNCLYDSVSVTLSNRGIVKSPSELRSIAESPSVANFKYGVYKKVSHILNNDITRKIFLKAQNSLLVGGTYSPDPLVIHNGRGLYPGGIIYDERRIGEGMIEVFTKLHTYFQYQGEFKNEPREKPSGRSQGGNGYMGPKKKTMKGGYERRFLDHETYTDGKILDMRNPGATGKGGAMVGVMLVVLKDPLTQKTHEYKIWSLSGDKKYSFTQALPKMNTGFEFSNVDYENHTKKIYNVHSKQYLEREYEKSCSAVKLQMATADHLEREKREGRDWVVEKQYMAEVYFKPGKSSKVHLSDLNKCVWASCKTCCETLPHSRSDSSND